MEFISGRWEWYVAGPAIALVAILLLLSGKVFGISSSMRHMCAACGAGRWSSFFRYNWKAQRWNLVFVLGVLIGAYLANAFLMGYDDVTVAESTRQTLESWGIAVEGYVPSSVFTFDALFSLRGILMMVVGGFLVGFGTRYAGGCTSGHAISGLANLQLPSLIAVIGFFLGGLLMTHFILPLII